MSESTIAASPRAEALRQALQDPTTSWPGVTLREHQLEALDELAAFDPRKAAVDLGLYKASIGIDDDRPALTYAELQERCTPRPVRARRSPSVHLPPR